MTHDDSARSPTLELLSAIASGDASPQEGAAQLRTEGLDALDVLTELLANAGQRPERTRSARHTIDMRGWFETAKKSDEPIVHGKPRVPILLNGTLYDPEDINRFDGTELHFVPARGHLLAFEEKSVIAEFWRTQYVKHQAEEGSVQYGGISPATLGAPHTQNRWGLGSYGGYYSYEEFCRYRPDLCPPPYGVMKPPPPPAPTPPDPGTRFFEDINAGGDTLILQSGYNYPRLSQVYMGFLGLGGDWNDMISSVWMVGTQVTILHEHKYFGGSTLTLTDPFPGTPAWGGPQHNLMDSGWSDRASSVETW